MTDARSRSVDLDVVRAIALIGVCVMNYHGYLNRTTAGEATDAVGRFFDPWSGPLSTRFAATFVTAAGMGVVLLAGRSPGAVSTVRWVLVRRGVLLLAGGFVLDWVWPGTILFFYGGYFVVAAVLFALPTRQVVAVGVLAALAAAALQAWAIDHPLRWLLTGDAEQHHSPRELLFDLFVRGTHPLLPWLAFVCLGMVLQRHMPSRPDRRVLVAFAGVIAVLVGYGLEAVLPVDAALRSTDPFSRSLPYVLTAGGTATVAVVAIGAIARATSQARLTRWLAVAGRSTLTLYVLHVFAFHLLVDGLDIVHFESGLGTALTMAVGFWVVAVAAAVAWQRVAPIGPLEWLYRRFSDAR